MATPSSHRRELCSTRPVCSVLIVLLWAESSDALNYSGSNSSMNISGSGGTSISSSGSSTATEKLLAILTCLLDITCVGLILAWKYRQNSNRRTDHSMLFPAKVTCQQEAALDSCNAAPAADGEQIPVPVAPLTGLATQSSVHRLQQANNDTISGENDGLPDIVWGTHVFHGLFDYSGHPTLDRFVPKTWARVRSVIRLSNKKRAFKGRTVEIGRAQASWLWLCTIGTLQASSLPSITFEKLGERLGLSRRIQAEWQACFGGGGIFIWIFAAAWIIPNQIGIASWFGIDDVSPASTVPYFLAGWLTTIFGLLYLFFALSQNDHEWTDIDSFLEHRHVRKNMKNTITLVSQVFSLAQLFSLSLRVIPKRSDDAGGTSSYHLFIERMKKWFATLMFEFHVIDDHDVDYFLLGFWLCVGAVVLWWVLFGGLLLRVVMNAGTGSSNHECQERFSLYWLLKNKHGSFNAFELLSETLMLAIVLNLLKMLTCTYANDGSATLLDKPNWSCWDKEADNPQKGFASIAMLALAYYIPTAVLLAPFVLADSDKLFQPDELDLRFQARFTLLERIGKLVLTALTVMASKYSWPLLLMQFNIFVFLAYYVKTRKPCSILWMNEVRGSLYAASAWAAFTGLIHTLTPLEWWPLVFLLVGLLILVLKTVNNVRYIAGMAHEGNIDRGDSCGVDQATSIEFDDSASMRGLRHHLIALNVWIATKDDSSGHQTKGANTRIAGLQCTYTMDGFVQETPRHLTSYSVEHGWTLSEETVTFADDEFIVGLSLVFDKEQVETGACALRLVMASHGTFHDQQTIPKGFAHSSRLEERECFSMRDVGSKRVVGFHGFTDKGLSQLGPVLDRHRKTLPYSKACSMFAMAAGLSLQATLPVCEFKRLFQRLLASDAEVIFDTEVVDSCTKAPRISMPHNKKAKCSPPRVQHGAGAFKWSRSSKKVGENIGQDDERAQLTREDSLAGSLLAHDRVTFKDAENGKLCQFMVNSTGLRYLVDGRIILSALTKVEPTMGSAGMLQVELEGTPVGDDESCLFVTIPNSDVSDGAVDRLMKLRDHKVNFDCFCRWLHAGSPAANSMLKNWKPVPFHCWATDRAPSYVQYTEGGMSATAIAAIGRPEEEQGEWFGPHDGIYGNCIDTLLIHGQKNITGQCHIEVEVVAKGTCMSIGIGKRPNLLDGVTDYGFTGDGSYVLFTTLWTSQSPSSGHLKGDYVAHSTDPNGKPVSVAFGAGDNIGMLIDRDQNTICFLKNGVRIDSAISCDLPPPQVELCVLAMLDCGGDSLILRSLPLSNEDIKLLEEVGGNSSMSAGEEAATRGGGSHTKKYDSY